MSGGIRTCGGLAALAVALGAGAEARASHHRFDVFTGEHGLSQMSVEAVVEDADGYLWVGTQSGLDRFDGQRFVSYSVKDGLSSGRIRSLALGPGALWIGTDGGLDRLVDGRVEAFGREHGLGAVQVRALAVDGATLWVGTKRGLHRWRPGEGFARVPEVGEPIDALWLEPGGDLLVGSGPASWRVDAEGVARRLEGGERIVCFAEDRAGAALAGDEGGVVRRLVGDAWEHHLEPSPGQRSPIRTLYVDGLGATWIGDEYGLARFQDGKLRRFDADDQLRLGVVTAVLETSAGQLWAGGFGGLARFSGRAFEVFDESDGLPTANTRSIVRTPDGTLWVGTFRGVARFDGQRFEAFDVEDGLPGHYVIALHADSEGRIWAGTNRGLVTFRADEGWRRHLEGVGGPATAIDEDGRGRVWATVAHAGLFRDDGAGLRRVAAPVAADFANPRMLVDREDRVWIADEDGLLRLDGPDDETGHRVTAADGLAHPEPYFMAEAPDGAIWFGYHDEAGLSRYDGASVRTWTTADGLSHDSVYSLGFDAEGALWVGTARGVDRFVDGRFVPYGPPEGYPSTESNAGGFRLDPDGRIWFGTAEGLARYDPRRDSRGRGALRLALGGLRVGEATVAADGASVPHGSAHLEATLDLVDFGHPRHRQLRARLLGLSPQWVTLGEPRWFVPSLPPGAYTLEVEARRAGAASVQRASRRFTVAAPWWTRTWVWAAAGLVVGALVLLGARWRVRSLARHNARLTEMVAARTATLETKATELERIRDDLRGTNEQLRAASAAKSQFVANVSHEIRTPMNGIMGMTELALAESISPVVRDYLDTVRASGRDLLDLIDDILDLSRIEAGRMTLEPEPASLSKLLGGLERQFSVAARAKGLTLEVRRQEGLHDRWSMDAGRLRQVLVNLVGNALKFTAKGGVVVSAQEAAEGGIEFRVTDTGIGIPQAQQGRVFEMFTQADGSPTRVYGGSGLGLTICQELVGLMGGAITLESAVGVGSTFRFAVPLEPVAEGLESSGELGAASGFAVGETSRSLHVLVAEDNAVNRRVVQRMLERFGHRVAVVEDGLQAVAAVERERFDLVLMDLQMPNLDGLEATTRIRAQERRDRRLPVFALTAHAMTGDKERALAAGMDGYLTKPLVPDVLQRTLQSVRPAEQLG